jgi:predicted RNA-binding Zn ribbon-like protein
VSRGSRFALVGGHPVLDLVNTVSWRRDPARRIERVPDFAALLAWSGRAGIADAAERRRLARRAPETGARALRAVHMLREHLHDALTSTGRPREEAIELLWPELTTALCQARPAGLPVRAEIYLAEPCDLQRRLALLALDLFRSEDVGRVSVCADAACGWVFLDRSHNRTRRWCSSSDCGNRNRVRQYTARPARAQRPRA